MMRRGRKNARGRKFVCHKCGATPPWSSADKHREKCHKTVDHRHRKGQ